MSYRKIMLADFFTKPLQGTLFKKFRDVLMRYNHISTLSLKSIANKERVEKNKVFANSETKFKEVKFKNPLHVHIDDKIKMKKVTDEILLTKSNVNKNEEQIKQQQDINQKRNNIL